MPRVDLAAIGRSLPYELQPVWIEAQAIEPSPQGNAPALPEPPPPDPVNHMQYAFEWFAFALIPIIGWPIALRRLARQRSAATNVTTDEHREHDTGAQPQRARREPAEQAVTADHGERATPTTARASRRSRR